MKTVSIIIAALILSVTAHGQAVRAIRDTSTKGDVPIVARASVPDINKTQLITAISPTTFRQVSDPLMIGEPGDPVWIEPGHPVWVGVFLHVAEADAGDADTVERMSFQILYNPTVSSGLLRLPIRKPDDPITTTGTWTTTAYGQERPVLPLDSLPRVTPSIWTATPENAAVGARIAFDCPFAPVATIPPGVWFVCEVPFLANSAEQISLNTGVGPGGVAYSQVTVETDRDFWSPRGASYPVPDRLGDYIGIRLPEAAAPAKPDTSILLQQITAIEYMLGQLRADVEGL